MAWPELPRAEAPLPKREQDRWDNLDEDSKRQIQEMRDYNKRESEKHLEEGSEGYPIGEFFGTGQGDEVDSIFGN